MAGCQLRFGLTIDRKVKQPHLNQSGLHYNITLQITTDMRIFGIEIFNKKSILAHSSNKHKSLSSIRDKALMDIPIDKEAIAKSSWQDVDLD